MRSITKTHTGIIVSDTDLNIEYLYVGDYGKDKNIKADFLGYYSKINMVENTGVDLLKKLVITISTQNGCQCNCNFCDCPSFGFKGNLSVAELVSEMSTALSLSGVSDGQRLNLHYARMGEPTFNKNVLTATPIIAEISKAHNFKEFHPVVSTMCPKYNRDLEDFVQKWVRLGDTLSGGVGLQFSINTLDESDRNKAFNNMSLSLEEISELIKRLPMPTGRKYTLNFAVDYKTDMNAQKMDSLFDKDKCIIKVTPIHATRKAIESGYETSFTFDIYRDIEAPLVKDGWDVIVFIPSDEEDSDRITCGNSLIAINK